MNSIDTCCKEECSFLLHDLLYFQAVGKTFSFSTFFHLSSFFLKVICHYYILEVVQESCIYNYLSLLKQSLVLKITCEEKRYKEITRS